MTPGQIGRLLAHKQVNGYLLNESGARCSAPIYAGYTVLGDSVEATQNHNVSYLASVGYSSQPEVVNKFK